MCIRDSIYDTSLVGLREKEAELLRDQMDQIDSRLAMSQSLNDLFDKYMATRKDLSARTYAGYMYQYNAYVRKTIGKRKIRDIKYSDILLFYKDLLEKYGHPTPEALVEAAWRHIRILESMDYRNIKISLKAHDVPLTIAAYRLLASQCDYPLHVGITEAGTINSGIIKSAVGIGTLLAEGIGDTIRVSLTGDPVQEVKTGFAILKALGLREYGPTLISCPTCGRTRINLEKLALTVEKKLDGITEPITVAVMGCVVNGPGEAREADVGIAGGIGEGLLFRKGEILRKVKEEEIVDELFKEIDKILMERKNK